MNIDAAKFILALPCGFVDSEQLPKLAKLDEHCLLVVRCNLGRFVTPAYCAERYIKAASALPDDYVRDVSVHSNDIAQAKRVLAAQLEAERQRAVAAYRNPKIGAVFVGSSAVNAALRAPAFNEADCGGAFDGSRVTSDADPGL